jgi:putative ABC transport system ATP-binding protein
MLELKHVDKTYQGPKGQSVSALRDVTLQLAPGEFVTVQGPSGCGKSTLLLVCGGLLSPDGGDVTLGQTRIYEQSPEARAKLCGRRVGFVFQQFHLIPYLSLRDNILTAALTDPSAPAQTRADTLMTEFGLQDRAHHLPAALSIGERQRTALARAMLNEPQVILADEPTGNLDPDNSTGVLESLSRFADSGGIVLMVTHNPDNARYASRCLHMNEGKLS